MGFPRHRGLLLNTIAINRFGFDNYDWHCPRAEPHYASGQMTLLPWWEFLPVSRRGWWRVMRIVFHIFKCIVVMCGSRGGHPVRPH